MDEKNGELSAMIDEMGLHTRILLAGSQNDIPAVMNALDLHVLSSASEAFPNVVAEAMACGTPCVVTDVGDAALIVGPTGWVAPPQDSVQLAGRIEEARVALDGPGREEFSHRCRSRIVDNFDLRRMVDAYESVWTLAAYKGQRRSECVA
jgi:glycosyltransferase involved in cell wall biosynthesis